MERAYFQSIVWQKALDARQSLTSPEEQDWTLSDDLLKPVLMQKEPAPRGLIELSKCGCKKSSCSRANCTCKVNGLACTEACACMTDEHCQNPRTILLDDGDIIDEDNL